jgi:hypothetical protein
MTSLHVIMSEFGPYHRRLKHKFRALFKRPKSLKERLNPTLDSLREYFPECRVTLYTDQPFLKKHSYENLEVALVKPSFNSKENRYGWRCNDYYKVYGLLETDADFAISLDADMRFISSDFKGIIDLAKKYGFCLPLNPRQLVKNDGLIGADSDYKVDEDLSRGNGFACNATPIIIDTKNQKARSVIAEYLKLMEENPRRGPLALWRAIWNSGVNPCFFPFQWCVCESEVNCGDEIGLHVGHSVVDDFYKRCPVK